MNNHGGHGEHGDKAKGTTKGANSRGGAGVIEGVVEDLVDAVMHHAEAVPWGKRWAAQVPRVIGPCIGDDSLDALKELRARIAEDLEGVLARMERVQRRERMRE